MESKDHTTLATASHLQLAITMVITIMVITITINNLLAPMTTKCHTNCVTQRMDHPPQEF